MHRRTTARLAAILAVAMALAACDQDSTTSSEDASAPPSEASPSPVPRTPVELRATDGVRIAGSLFGDGSVGVVLGPGSDGDAEGWWPFAETLARHGYTALAILYRGFCPGGEEGCSEDGGSQDVWKDMLGGVRYLRAHGVDRVVLMGSSMGGTAAVVAASQVGANAVRVGLAGMVSLSGPVSCCGMTTGRRAVEAIRVPMLFVAGKFDTGFAGSTRRFGEWAGDSGEAVIVESGEHGYDFFHLATPDIQARVSGLVFDLLDRVSADPPATLIGQWGRTNSCRAFVTAFGRAGLNDLVPDWLVTAGYVSSVSQVDPAHPCTGAVEDRNDYFFQESGRFGSLDQDTVLIDDGSYRRVDANTIAIVGRLTGRAFLADYAITHDRIRFDVADQANCAGDCREDLAWVLSMFYPGELSRAE